MAESAANSAFCLATSCGLALASASSALIFEIVSGEGVAALFLRNLGTREEREKERDGTKASIGDGWEWCGRCDRKLREHSRVLVERVRRVMHE